MIRRLPPVFAVVATLVVTLLVVVTLVVTVFVVVALERRPDRAD